MRKVYRITGADRVKFLQNLVSNDLSRLSQGHAVYAALLTPQGKYLADFFLAEAADSILVDVAAGLADDLVKRLNLYRLRADVAIVDAGLNVLLGTGVAPEGAVADPRHDALGWRLYGEKAGDLAEDRDGLRISLIVPESLIELQPNDSYILEFGFERLHGVDFRKGCYVGQEVTARMKHKTELRKGLTRVALAGAVPVGAAILADGREVGRVFTNRDGFGLAYLRFDSLAGEMSCDGVAVSRDDSAQG